MAARGRPKKLPRSAMLFWARNVRVKGKPHLFWNKNGKKGVVYHADETDTEHWRRAMVWMFT